MSIYLENLIISPYDYVTETIEKNLLTLWAYYRMNLIALVSYLILIVTSHQQILTLGITSYQELDRPNKQNKRIF